MVYSIGLATVNAVFILGFAEAFCSMVGWDSSNVGTLRTIGIIAELVRVCVCVCACVCLFWVRAWGRLACFSSVLCLRVGVSRILLCLVAILNFSAGVCVPQPPPMP